MIFFVTQHFPSDKVASLYNLPSKLKEGEWARRWVNKPLIFFSNKQNKRRIFNNHKSNWKLQQNQKKNSLKMNDTLTRNLLLLHCSTFNPRKLFWQTFKKLNFFGNLSSYDEMISCLPFFRTQISSTHPVAPFPVSKVILTVKRDWISSLLPYSRKWKNIFQLCRL